MLPTPEKPQVLTERVVVSALDRTDALEAAAKLVTNDQKWKWSVSMKAEELSFGRWSVAITRRPKSSGWAAAKAAPVHVARYVTGEVATEHDVETRRYVRSVK